MAHGLPTGYVRLYDDGGNPVDVGIGTDGKYALMVKDDRAAQLLSEILDRLTPEPVEDPWDGEVTW